MASKISGCAPAILSEAKCGSAPGVRKRRAGVVVIVPLSHWIVQSPLVGVVKHRPGAPRDAHELVILVVQPDVPDLGTAAARNRCRTGGDDVTGNTRANVVGVDFLTDDVLFVPINRHGRTNRACGFGQYNGHATVENSGVL